VGVLNRDSIIGAVDFGIKEHEVPEWGGTVYLRKWSAKDRNAYIAKSVSVDENGGHVNYENVFDSVVWAVAMSLCDENGIRLFADNEIDILAQKNGDVMQKLCEEVYRLNGLASNSIEESAKN
jgi:hypothetical protein